MKTHEERIAHLELRISQIELALAEFADALEWGGHEGIRRRIDNILNP